MKKFISFVLSIVMVVGMTTPVFASDETIYMNVENCYQSEKQREYVSERVTEIIKELRLDERNTFSAIWLINNQMKENIEYDHEHLRDFNGSRRTAYCALKNGYTVCVGYSQLTMEFCKQLDIPCEYVHLWFKNTYDIYHIINMVYMEDTGKWYYWDPTYGIVLIGSEYAEVIYRGIKTKTSYYDNTEKEVAEDDYSYEVVPVRTVTEEEYMTGKAIIDKYENYSETIDFLGMKFRVTTKGTCTESTDFYTYRIDFYVNGVHMSDKTLHCFMPEKCAWKQYEKIEVI